MSYLDSLATAIVVISIVGSILGTYATYKIYSKEGFR